MADVTYKCTQCQKTRMVSEFADPDKIVCSDCDIKMISADDAPPVHAASPSEEKQPPAKAESSSEAKAETTAPPAPTPKPPKEKGKLKLARARVPEPTEEPEPKGKVISKKVLEPEGVRAPLELHPKKNKKRKKKGVSHTVWAFCLFAILGTAAFYLRYYTLYLLPYLDYAWIGVLAMHILVTLKALSDDMMQGILCLFIPGWSLFYLIVSDNYYYKAVIFALLLGIGYDGAYQLLGYVMNILGAIQEFINSGGGETRRASMTGLTQYFCA